MASKIKNTKTYFIKWFIASLIAPAVVYLTKSSFGGIVLFFWPSSIFLMALGANENPASQVAYVWAMAVSTNIALYLIIGLIIYYVVKINNKNNENT